MTQYQFKPEARLLRAFYFNQVFSLEPKKIHSPYFTVLYVPNTSPTARLGLVIAKKHIRRAHERNRIKRLIREGFRLHCGQMKCVDVVFMAKHSALLADNEAIRTQLAFIWEKLGGSHGMVDA